MDGNQASSFCWAATAGNRFIINSLYLFCPFGRCRNSWSTASASAEVLYQGQWLGCPRRRAKSRSRCLRRVRYRSGVFTNSHQFVKQDTKSLGKSVWKECAMKPTAVITFHSNPYTCGVARFNIALAQSLNVPMVTLGDFLSKQVPGALLSIKC